MYAGLEGIRGFSFQIIVSTPVKACLWDIMFKVTVQI